MTDGTEEFGTRLLRVGQMARLAGVSVETLRYYERLGLLTTTRTSGGQRLHSENNLRIMHVVKGLQHLGFSLSAIADLFVAASDRPHEPAARVRYDALVVDITERMADLEAIRAALTLDIAFPEALPSQQQHDPPAD